MIKKTKFSLITFFLVPFFLGDLIQSQAQSLPNSGATSKFTLFTGAEAVTHSATILNIMGNIGINLSVISGFQPLYVTGIFINPNYNTQTPKQDLISAYTMFQNLVLL